MSYVGSYQEQTQISIAKSGRSEAWNVFWKIYFFALVALDIAFPFLLPEFYIDLSPLVIADTAMMLVGFIGLFGFAWQERIFGQNFWKGYLVALLLYVAAIFVVPMSPGVKEAIEKDLTHILMLLIPMIALHLPVPIAVILYAFKSKEVWQTATSEADKRKS